VLGRFEVSRGGRTVELAPGREAQLLKLVAVNGGTVLADQAIETLWPEVAPDVGRNRLRTVLDRLRADAGDVVRREGDALTLGPDVRLDLAEFKREAREALALGRESAAVAISRARRSPATAASCSPTISTRVGPKSRAKRRFARF
jgi:DNA-binding SARP family transcriptional activator